MGYGESNDHMTDNIRRPENVKIVSQIYLDANILKRQEIQDQFQCTTIRNWFMSNRFVTQSRTSHDLVKRASRRLYQKRDGIGQIPCSYERYLVILISAVSLQLTETWRKVAGCEFTMFSRDLDYAHLWSKPAWLFITCKVTWCYRLRSHSIRHRPISLGRFWDIWTSPGILESKLAHKVF